MFMRVITERIRSWSDVVQGLYPVDSKRSQSGVYLNSAPEEGDDLHILDTAASLLVRVRVVTTVATTTTNFHGHRSTRNV
jgi:hypothetical protein